MRLAPKILIICLLLSLVPLGLIGLISYGNGEKAIGMSEYLDQIVDGKPVGI